MKKSIKLTEQDLYRIINRLLKEDEESAADMELISTEEFSTLSTKEKSNWETNKISWKKAIQECLKELDSRYNTKIYSSLPKKLIGILSFSAFLIGIGFATNIKELKLMGTITALAAGVLTHPEIQEIIICAVNKRKGKSNIIDNLGLETQNESNRTIKLTETELIKLVKKIIK